MHHRAALLFVGMTLTGANQAIAQDPAAAVRKLAADYAAACSRGDAKAVAAFYTADAVNVEAGPVRSVGREAIEKKVAADYAGPFKGAKCTITVTSVRFSTTRCRARRRRIQYCDSGTANGGGALDQHHAASGRQMADHPRHGDDQAVDGPGLI
jgi:uncharacterized protein (TIGR02246 family)